MTKITVTFDNSVWTLVPRVPTQRTFKDLIPRAIHKALIEQSPSDVVDFFSRWALGTFALDYERMINWGDDHPGVRAALRREQRERNKRSKAASDRRKAKEKAAREAKRAGRSVKTKG